MENNNDTKQTIFNIPECNLSSLQVAIDKLNKKAVKLGCIPITLQVINTYDKKVNKDGISFDQYIRYNTVEIIGSAPIINGWELIASCEQKENGTMIKSIPEKTYPEKYRSLMICEHCHSDRYRRYTFIVRNITTNDYEMVGKQCLKDFLGHKDPAFIANYMQWITDPSISEYEDENFGEGSGEYRINTESYLAYVSACIRSDGWLSRSAVKEKGGQPTADYALTSMQKAGKPEYSRYNGQIIEYPTPDDQDQELAIKSLEWAKSLTDTKNDYLYNINLLAKEETITYKDLGFVASIIPSYQKTLEIQIKREQESKQKAISEYVGNVGDKVILDLTYLISFSFDGFNGYGVTYIHKFSDKQGNTFTWKTNNSLEYLNNDENDVRYGDVLRYNQNDVLKIKGTIKEHNEHKGEKQTVLTRCKIIL